MKKLFIALTIFFAGFGYFTIGCIGFLGMYSSIGAEFVYSTGFERDGWSKDDWIFVKSPRWTYIGEWLQHDDHIQNRVPPNVAPDRLVGSSLGCAYMSMVLKEPCSIGDGLEITARMEFEYDQGPQIVLAADLGCDDNGYPEHREHYEIVLFARGINIWHHTYTKGEPKWVLVSYARFPIEQQTPYDLKVVIEPVRASRSAEVSGSMIVVSVDGKNTFAYYESALPDKLYVGIIGYASANRFYSFGVRN